MQMVTKKSSLELMRLAVIPHNLRMYQVQQTLALMRTSSFNPTSMEDTINKDLDRFLQKKVANIKINYIKVTSSLDQ